MGIHGLMKLLSEECPDAIKEHEMDYLTGRKVAIDASMAMYQFLIAVRSSGDGHAATMLTNEAGEVTSHIQGMFNRTIKMLTTGVKPVYVFDGKPPQMKGGELAKRIAKRAQAETSLQESKDAEDVDDINKFSRRLVKVTRQHNEDCKELLRLMGVPVIDAPCEAEAQCAELAKKGKVYATATEDMDALTFRTPILLRKLTFSGNKQPITEIRFDAVLSGLGITYEQFVDLCILCGCDYCSTVKGIGPKTALKLIRQYQSIENVISHLEREKKHQIPLDWKTQTKKEREATAAAALAAIAAAKAKKLAAKNEKKDTNGDAAEVGSETLPGDDDAVDDDEEEEDDQEDDQDEDLEENGVVAAEKGDSSAIPGGEDSLPTGDVVVESKSESEQMVHDADSLEVTEPETEEDEVVPPLYAQARELFVRADVLPGESVELRWVEADEEGLRSFLVERMQFNLERVNNAIKKLKEAQPKQAQQRMDSFFKPVAAAAAADASKKRKVEPSKAAQGKGKVANKGGWGGKKR